jgi:hypothetical protein
VHLLTVFDQSLDDGKADESRRTGDEHAGHAVKGGLASP